MEQMQIGPWRIAYDQEATAQAYQGVPRSGADECRCQGCRNFRAARYRVYSPEILDRFHALGINPEREAEVVDFGPMLDRPGYRAGNGWFHIVGEVLQGPPDANSSIMPDDVELTVMRRSSLVPKSFEGKPVIQLEWIGPVPWVLDEQPDDLTVTG